MSLTIYSNYSNFLNNPSDLHLKFRSNLNVLNTNYNVCPKFKPKLSTIHENDNIKITYQKYKKCILETIFEATETLV
jgi:hypothetical protein